MFVVSLKYVVLMRVVFLAVAVEDVPWVPFDERVAVETLGHGCWRVTARFGFKNRADTVAGGAAMLP